jgi:hypothetical protein
MSAGTSLFNTQNVQIGFLKVDDPIRGDNSQHYILSKGPSDISSPNQPSRGVDTIASSIISLSIQSAANLSPIPRPTKLSESLQPSISYDIDRHTLIYKPVARKVHTVPKAISEEYHITRQLPDSPLAGLLELPVHPLTFIPGTRFTQEHQEKPLGYIALYNTL